MPATYLIFKFTIFFREQQDGLEKPDLLAPCPPDSERTVGMGRVQGLPFSFLLLGDLFLHKMEHILSSLCDWILGILNGNGTAE